MTKTELNGFRRILEKRRIELVRGNTSREALAIETSADELDRIQCAGERDHAMGNLARNSSGIREARIALSRIDTGTFGICVDCQGNIDPRRLAAVPWASFCIRCQEAADREPRSSADEMDHPSLVGALVRAA